MMRAYRPMMGVLDIEETVSGPVDGETAGPESFPAGPFHKDRPPQTYNDANISARPSMQLFPFLRRINCFLSKDFYVLDDCKIYLRIEIFFLTLFGGFLFVRRG